MVFSKRLDWRASENALAALERQRRAAGASLFDLTISNPTSVGLPSQAEALAAAFADPTIARYQPSPLGPPAAREAIAADRAAAGWTLPADRIALTASSSESYALLFKLLCDPGDLVLVPEPSYPLFDYLAHLEGVATRRYRLAYDGHWHIDWSSFDPAGARALVLVNPNNPTGSYLRAADWQRLCALAVAHDFALIADEVFADYPLAAAPDAVRTVLASAPPALTFVLGGLSKGAGLPQMKLGWIAVAGPDEVARAALARLELIADTYLSVGTPVLAALPHLLALGAQARDCLRERLATNRATLSAAVGPDLACSVLTAEAGWSTILRLPATRSDEDWALTLLREDDVLVSPGYFFDLTGLGSTLVLSLLPAPDIFAEGLRRLLDRMAAG